MSIRVIWLVIVTAALNAGLIEMTLPESPKSPTQKYRLTVKVRTMPS